MWSHKISIHWRYQLSIDGGAIDTDHKFLISLINEFEAEFEKGFDQYRILDALKRLEYYTVYHFQREKAIQQRIGFLDIKDHAEQHHQLNINVKGAIKLFSHEIPKTHQADVRNKLMRLLRLWIVGHVSTYDMKMKPYFTRRARGQAIIPMEDSEEAVAPQYRVLFREVGTSLGVQVVETECFIGLSFIGHAIMDDSRIMAKACELINGSTSASVVVCMRDLTDFDEYFIGHLLVLLGTLAEGGRGVFMVIGSGGPSTAKLKRLGVDRIIHSFPSNDDFYREVGFRV
ncbi:MAG: hemerythrin family protein [Rhodospirillaceae bacterium]